MADPIATVLSHLTNLVTFRSSLRLLIIAGSIICCWVFIEPKLSPFKLPNELSLTLITVIGFSFGALLSATLFNSLDLVIKFATKKIDLRNKQREIQKEEETRKANEHQKVELFKKSFNDYSLDAKEILLKLKDNDCTIESGTTVGEAHNNALLGLLENKIILPQHRLDKRHTYCTINPLYKDAIIQAFDEKHRKEVDEVFSLESNDLNMLLKKFSNKTYEDNHVFNIVHSIYRNRYNYMPVIKHEFYDEGDFIENCNIQFYVSDPHYPFVCEKLGSEIRGYILGNYNEEVVRKRRG
ncbi:hypothetical protein ACE3IK_08365 [Enterobacter hormaechei subsp. xiangfangensis]|uniref:hypothetical protein n=1 Tax=Enterobacter cloacae complex TaxID=354276 RepID=UPI0006DA9202|nr:MULTISPECIES: hypothetical protein [Enterobacter cloacae complex]EJV1263976.1 hypothetical protein [Enterobacter hormaechei]ELY2060520.1 hypothetical protein [Enterobacter hormaechei]ELY2066183.1 hypothetical protein [Enterobacter hormaechei]MCD0239974.1 hypothetical protein [Enterobacter hormaechei]MCF2398240.1 hypothetical protein [Enterobacter hormaechei subsp. xiangfangensis]